MVNRERKEIVLYYSDPLLLRTRHLHEVRGYNLGSYRIHSHPTWRAGVFSSISPRQTGRFLVSIAYLKSRIALHHQLVLMDLAAEDETLSQFLLLLKKEKSAGLSPLSKSTNDPWLIRIRNLTLRVCGNPKPNLFALKWWDERIPLIGRRIGVGYKDHGSIATAPSWKDQMVSDTGGGTEEKGDPFLSELLTLLSFSEFLREKPPTDETQKVEKENV